MLDLVYDFSNLEEVCNSDFIDSIRTSVQYFIFYLPLKNDSVSMNKNKFGIEAPTDSNATHSPLTMIDLPSSSLFLSVALDSNSTHLQQKPSY